MSRYLHLSDKYLHLFWTGRYDNNLVVYLGSTAMYKVHNFVVSITGIQIDVMTHEGCNF